MKNTPRRMATNIRLAGRIWGPLSKSARVGLRLLVGETDLSVAGGDVQFLDNKWYVTHSGLVRLARRKHCAGISVRQVRDYCNPATNHWVFRATVFKRPGAK